MHKDNCRVESEAVFLWMSLSRLAPPVYVILQKDVFDIFCKMYCLRFAGLLKKMRASEVLGNFLKKLLE